MPRIKRQHCGRRYQRTAARALFSPLPSAGLLGVSQTHDSLTVLVFRHHAVGEMRLR